jgi:fucose permease
VNNASAPLTGASQRTSRLLVGIALVAFTAFGATHALLGPGWAAIRLDFHQPLGALGTLTAAGAITYGLASVSSGLIDRRFGAGGLLVVSYALILIGLVAVVTAVNFPLLVAAMAVLGAGHGLLDPAINTHVARHHGVSIMNLLHATFGVGATAGPLLMVVAADKLGQWRIAYAVVMGVSLCLLGVVIATRKRWGSAPRLDDPAGAPAPPSASAVSGILLAFLFAAGVETSSAQWASSILTEAHGLSPERAAGFMSGFWAGLTGGRLLGVIIGRRLSSSTLLVASLSLSSVGLGVLALAPQSAAAFGLPLTGAGQALVFPTLVVLVGDRFRDRAGALMGWACGAASAGSALLPWVLGWVAAGSGAAALSVWLFGFGGLLLVSGLLAARWSRPRSVTPANRSL